MADFTDNEKLASLYVSSGKTQDSRVGGAEWLRKMALHIFNNSTSAKGTYSGVSEKLAPVDDDVLLVEDSESEFVKKRVKLGNLPGYRVTNEYMLHGDAGANFVMTNATLAERFAGNTTRHIRVVNAAGYSQVRFLANVQVASASASTPKLRLRYYTSWNATFANYLQLGASGHVEVSVFTGTAGTLQDSGWIDLASGAMADGIALAMCEVGGDAAADPAIGWAAVWFR